MTFSPSPSPLLSHLKWRLLIFGTIFSTLLTSVPVSGAGQQGWPGLRVTCQAKCNCSDLKVSCFARSVLEIPQDLPATIQYLEIQKAQLTEIRPDAFRRYADLQTIIIMRTGLHAISRFAFRGLPQLTEIRLNYNKRFSGLPSHALAALNGSHHKIIDLQSNRLISLPPLLLDGSFLIRRLDFRSNPIREIRAFAFKNVYSLDFLFLPDHLQRIQQDAFNGLVRVYRMELANWRTTKSLPYTFRGLEQIKHLTIRHPKIDHLSQDTFAGLHTIEFLVFFNAEFGKVAANSFSNIENIRLILLQYSYVAELNASLSSLIRHRLLSLNQTRIDCNCGNLWLLSRYSGLTNQAMKSTYCHQGPWDTRSIWHVRKEYIQQCSRNKHTTLQRRRQRFRQRKRPHHLQVNS